MQQAVCLSISIRGLSFQGRFPVLMSVLQPCPQGVQPAVIVFGITVVPDSAVIVEKMAVRVERSLDSQYLLQLGQCPTVFVVLSRIAAILFRQGIGIIDELPVTTDIGTCVYRPFPADLVGWLCLSIPECREPVLHLPYCFRVLRTIPAYQLAAPTGIFPTDVRQVG
ncbi:Uncharacterised protein [Rikenella microfusus]|uniref:Uncharacterized protein n=1 Tax=Rikenella microfusus TaxID=28139 RepID=A0A379MSH1_9BACT|nr:Uncharacterised protein [Rikenella microfusus]